MYVSWWMIRPDASRTVRVTETSLPSTGHSVRRVWPRGRAVVRTVESAPATTFVTIGRLSVTLRPVGTDQSSKRTTPGDAKPRTRIAVEVSFRKRIDCEPDTVASRPSGYRVM